MRVIINGFGEFSDTLHIEIPKWANWRALTNILSINGVRYYYTQLHTIGIRYEGFVDPIDVAAQALIVAAAFCDVPLYRVEVEVKERYCSDVNEDRVAAEIKLRMMTVSTPADVSIHQVEPRGTGPAYWLL